MSFLTLERVTIAGDWAHYHEIRRRVLFEARGCAHYDPHHPDETKEGAYPLLLKKEGRPIGTVRLDHISPQIAIVRMLAITQDHQGQGYGRALEDLICEKARSLGVRQLYVNAAKEAIAYYTHLGWQFFVWNEEENMRFLSSGGRQLEKKL
ncbi:MAG: GNAT family N-acetyltransferase [Alphaproteobacteria bacterium]|nr:GNAT family N-acetyltransferase [Alphaproteobacteria bacterium]